jgi:Response regulator containing a CheY-like receiver domain and an HTH DNA-binding domain
MNEGSGKGIFPPGTARHGPPSAKRRSAHVDRLKHQRARRREKLADLVADGWSVAAAAKQLGVSQQTGHSMWREICDAFYEGFCK